MLISQEKQDSTIIRLVFMGVSFWFLFFIFSPSLFAQIAEPNLILTSSTQTPNAHETITLRVESYATDLNKARVDWYVDGDLLESGQGLKEVSLQLGNLGETVEISVRANTQEGLILRETLSFTPASVSLVWESNTYTPPFYKGRALLTADNDVTVVALPHLTTNSTTFLNPQELIYTWSQNGRVLGSKSGFGKQTLVLDGPSLFQESVISVSVSSFGGSLKAQNTITLTPREPVILFYEKDPLRGVLFERTIPINASFDKDEFTLRAEPYFFSKKDAPQNLTFLWSLNNSLLQNARGQEVVFRKPEGSGSSQIGLRITNDANFLQEARVERTIMFGNTSRLGL